jgi:anhydro-N-acetylmuramic acid kinase
LRSDSILRVALNIGGIANVTILPPRGGLDGVTAYDTGPGNMVLDGAVQILTNGDLRFDNDGTLATNGEIHEGLVTEWLNADSYVRARPPKSTGREHYGQAFVLNRLAEMRHLCAPDQLATLTAFVAETIAANLRMSVHEEMELFISGGGQHNNALVKGIVERAKPIRVLTTESVNIPSDMKEAMAFALLAWQFTHGRKTNVPTATGANRSVMLGQWTPPT